MQFKICLFCKRSLEQFCYSIYDSENQPYLNIMQLFGDVEDNLRHGRYICHECLYIIRWIYFMKKILADALLDEDIGENDKVIPAFNIFKVKMSQPIFVLAEEGGSDNEDDDQDVNEMCSNVHHVQSTDSESECRTPRNPQDYVFFNGDMGGKMAQRQPENGKIAIDSNNMHTSQFALADDNSNWWPTRQVGSNNHLSDEISETGGCSQKFVNSRENRLMQYSCTIKVCKHTCDTFDELKNHYHLHHLNDKDDLTMENYGKQLQEYNKIHSCGPNSRRKKFRCLLTHCRKAFKTIESLSEHKIKEHDLMAKFWCAECYNLPFISRDDLNQHSLIFHSYNITQRSNEYPCKYCDKYFLEKNLLSAHQLKHHHFQFLKQTEANLQSQASIVKKVVYKSANNSNSSNKCSNKGVCSFKMRPQKEVVSSKRKQDIMMKWLRTKYPHFNSKPLNISEQKLINPDKGKEKVLISLPPRKRRQYQVANDIELTQIVVNCAKLSTSESVESHSQVITDIKDNVVEVQQPVTVLELPKNVDSGVTIDTTSLMESTKLPVCELISDLLPQVNAPEQSENEKHLITNEIEPNVADQVTEPLKLSENNEIVNSPLVPEAVSVNITKDPVTIPEVTEVKVSLPLKTYNCRKRKKPHQKVIKTNCVAKKTKKLPENKTSICQELETPALQNATNDDSLALAPSKLETAATTLPPVVSKIEEKDNDNNPGRITMTISLKALKQYTNDKEVKRESKRQKKLKDKKKSKQVPPITTQQTANLPVINKALKKEIVPKANANLETENKKSIKNNLLNVPIVKNGPIIKEKHNLTTSKQYSNTVELAHASRDISESENEARNEVVLNKDEIHMIIFGETINSNSISNDIPMINEQIIDATADDITSTNISNGQIMLPETTSPAAPKPSKKRAKPKSRLGKKRKIKRKPDKIQKLTLDADGAVVDKKQLQKPPSIENDTDAEDTVEGQISNVQLKDHLYARSAFNAFKHSK